MIPKIHTETLAELLLVPIAGVLIPLITGLYAFLDYPLVRSAVFLFLPCILISFFIWEGNVRLMRQFRNKWYRRKHNVHIDFMRRIAIHVVFTFVTAMISLLLLMSQAGAIDSAILFKTCAAILIFVLIVTCVYEIIYLTEERETSALKAEELNYAKSEAELTALKNQIDPHFIFNSINTLSHLIKTSPDVAYLFNNNLATIYRYILFNKDREFVLLKEELEFVSHNFYLFRIRYEKAVNLKIEIADVKTENFLVPPISLQLLVENAIKHNEFTDDSPIMIHIQVTNGFVTVKNKIVPKKYFIPSTGIGLHNLSNRYRILTKKEISIDSEGGYFTVRLPLLSY